MPARRKKTTAFRPPNPLRRALPYRRGISGLTATALLSSLRKQTRTHLQPNATGLHLISPADSSNPAVADIIFVHGLGGASHDTWRHGKEEDDDHFFWPEELGKELPECNVWSVGYEADISRASGKGMVIGLRALAVASLMVSRKVGIERPVVFVCHSMGGLVVKALVDGCRQSTNPMFETIVKNTRGVIFCGTPHRGSGFANTAKTLGKLLGGSTEWTKEMCTGENGIELLHGRFLGWLRHNQIQLLTLVEHSISFGSGFLKVDLGIVVPGSSAVCATEPVFQHDTADHLQLVKPAGFTDLTYACTKEFIDNLLSAFNAGSGIPTP